MEFVKMHGLGNDFIFVQVASWEEAENLQNYAQWLCNRNYGIGADGLVAFGHGKDTDLFMRIFNPDGSEAEMCGNAIRCLAKYGWEKHLVVNDPIKVRTLSGVKYPKVIVSEIEEPLICVDMGEPILDTKQIPALSDKIMTTIEVGEKEFDVTVVSMGNPHCIILVDDVSSVDLLKWGPIIENHDLFPLRTNVEFMQVNNRQDISLKVWERGVGITRACGTGACATLVAAVLNGVSERKATIHLDGGDLIVEWRESDNHVYMTGPAKQVFTGNIELD